MGIIFIKIVFVTKNKEKRCRIWQQDEDDDLQEDQKHPQELHEEGEDPANEQQLEEEKPDELPQRRALRKQPSADQREKLLRNQQPREDDDKSLHCFIFFLFLSFFMRWQQYTLHTL